MKHTALVGWLVAGILGWGAFGSYAEDAASATSTNAMPVSTNAPAVSTNAQQQVSMRDAMSFQSLDANKDGKVTLEEYQAAMAAVAKTRFETMDTNKDGFLTETELNAGRGAGFRRAGTGGSRDRRGGVEPRSPAKSGE